MSVDGPNCDDPEGFEIVRARLNVSVGFEEFTSATLTAEIARLREAARLALEALEALRMVIDRQDVRLAIAKLREVLR